jgi:hypothetical protein
VTDDPPRPTHEPCGSGHQRPTGAECGLCRLEDVVHPDAARWTPGDDD